MRIAMAMGMAVASAVATVAVVLLLSSGSSEPSPAKATAARADRPAPASLQATRFGGAREDCSSRSEANFPGAFADPGNLVVGPLALVGGAFTDAATVRRFGGNKFPVLVKAGRSVTVRLTRRGRRFAGLAYGPDPQGMGTLRHSHRSVTFVACRPGRPARRYRAGGPSGSSADGVAVTFWSGFVLARRPSCLALDVYVDGARSPRRVGLPLGRRCG
jgi:hypothetical protein